MKRQTEETPTVRNYKVSYMLHDDADGELMEWVAPATSRKHAYQSFWYTHDNPDLLIVSCMPTDDPITHKEYYPTDIPDGFPAPAHLPDHVQVQDDWGIRGVYALSHLWIQDGVELFRAISSALHLIGSHSQMFSIAHGEPLCPNRELVQYSYLRDAAMFFDYVANGDNAVFSAGMARQVNHFFSDLTDN